MNINNTLLSKPNTLLFQTPFIPCIKTHLPKHTLLPFHLKFPSGSHLFASPKAQTITQDTDEFDIEEDEEFKEENEDEDIIVPLRNMRQWTQNKPRGFGEGKVYDTSMEDKLLEELEQSRVAQAANVINLKKNPEDGNPKDKILKQKAVAGNKKTREPVCKGFAFVDFKSEKEATRFVNMCSTQPITFGKVQKQIKCEIMKPVLPNPAAVKSSVHRTKHALPVTDASVAVISTPVIEKILDSYEEDAAFDRSENDDDEYNDSNIAKVDNVVKLKQGSEAHSEPVKKPKKVKEKGKKVTTSKKKEESTPKVTIPRSAKRLKVKEKDMLSGVFSKSGGKSAMAAKGTAVMAD